MARNHARIHVGIWQDDDFRELRPAVQRLYLFLLSQPNLSHLGVLPLTLRRWSQTAAAYTADDQDADLSELQEAGFVVVDPAEEELLVRSLLRRDGIYKQPNVMRAAIAAVPAVQSAVLKRALLAEVQRIDLADVPEDKGKKDEAASLLAALRAALSVPEPDPNDNPQRRVQGRVLDTPPEGFDIPPTHTRAQPLVLSPSPTTSTVPPTAAPLNAALDLVSSDLAPNAAGIVRAYVDACREVEQVVDNRAKGRIAREAAQLLADGAPFPLLVEAARRLAVNGFADIGAEARRLRGERAPKPSTTDQRVAQGLALVEKFREQEGA